MLHFLRIFLWINDLARFKLCKASKKLFKQDYVLREDLIPKHTLQRPFLNKSTFMCFEIDIHSTIHAVIAQFPNNKTVKKSRSTCSETTNPIPINKSNYCWRIYWYCDALYQLSCFMQKLIMTFNISRCINGSVVYAGRLLWYCEEITLLTLSPIQILMENVLVKVFKSSSILQDILNPMFQMNMDNIDN